jgi:iron complex outermembrane receptor protein
MTTDQQHAQWLSRKPSTDRLRASRAAFLAAAAFGALAAAPAAVAQSGAADGQRASADEVQEIIVTARRRAESVQDVGIAISALSSADLDRKQAGSIKDLSFSVPNLIVTNNQTTVTGAAVYIRGIGQDDSTPVQEQGVALYLDDIYLPRSQGALLDLIEFERVEVLRGPQGTLYGRNSTGGAVKFVTKKPDLQDATFVGDVTVGRFAQLNVRASASIPIIAGTLAAKIDALSLNRDGYLTRLDDGSDVNRVSRRGLRAAVAWEPSSDVRVDLAADWTWDRSGLQTGTPLTPGAVNQRRQPLFGDPYLTDPDVPDLNRFSGGGVSTTIAWDIGNHQLKSVSSYRKASNLFWGDLLGRSATSGGGLDIFRDYDQKAFTQEIQLISDLDGRINYVLGAFLMDEEFTNRDTLLFQHDYTQDTISAAAFGELTLGLADNLDVTLGARYSYDRKKLVEDAVTLLGSFSGIVRKSWNNFSPKIAVDYKVTPDVLIYGVFQKGYKVGAFQGFPQALADLQQQILSPEKVTTYELGTKTSFLDNRLTINVAGFYSDYTDRQLSLIDPATFNYVARTADARIYGAELEMRYTISSELLVYGFASWFNGKVKGADTTDPLVPPNGTKLAFTPPYMLQIGLSLDQPVEGLNGGRILFDASASYKGRIYFGSLEERFNSQDSHELVNAMIGYGSPDDQWRLTFNVKNLTNQTWAYTGNASGDGTLYFAEPRTWAATLKVRF